MPVSSVTEHWIKQDAITINLNHFGDPDYLQVSVLAGAVVMAFKQDVIGYNAAHNYRTWPLQAANTYLETSSAVNVYARLTRSEVNASALIIYDPVLRDIEGREISYEEVEGEKKEVLGDPNPDYFFIYLGEISASLSESGMSVLRDWSVSFRFGSLDTNQFQNEEAGGEWTKMFRLNKVTDLIDVLKTFSNAVFKKLSIKRNDKEKPIVDLKRSIDSDEEVPVSDEIIPTTKYLHSVTDERFLRKDKDDRSVGTISSDKGFEVGNYVPGELGIGGIFKIDENGDSYIEVDKALFRKIAYFVEIMIKKLSHVGGTIILSPASMRCSKVEEHETYYRCYFENEKDGKTINQEFVVGDQARSQEFNIKEGLSQNVRNQYYWRLVVGVGSNYIDLSKADCDSGSGVPLAGDDIVQLGNRDNPSRQRAIILSSYGEGTPSIIMYRGIKSYSMSDAKMPLRLSPDGNIIEGDFISKSGKNLEEWMSEVEVNWDKVLEQTDKEFTMWFFEYDPSPEVYPESEWFTDELRALHEQDLFYNTAKGMAWRYTLKDGVFFWELVTDADTLKALEDAARAQQTADGAVQRLDSIVSDGRLSAVEKKEVRKEWASIMDAYEWNMYSSERIGIDMQSQEVVGYSSAYNALSAYITPLLAEDGDSDINPDEYRGYWTDYYTTETKLRNFLSEKAKEKADDVEQEVNDMSSDGVLSALEKKEVLKEWMSVAEEYAINIENALKYEADSTSYTDAYMMLGTYMNNGQTWDGASLPLWLQDLSTNQSIENPDAYRSLWVGYYNTKVALLDEISNIIKEKADNAQKDADEITNRFDTIVSDSILSTLEKKEVLKEWLSIVEEYRSNIETAQNFGMTTDDSSLNEYVNAYNALGSYMDGDEDELDEDKWDGIRLPSWLADLSTNQTIVGDVYRSRWTAYYDTERVLLSRISVIAKDKADDAQKDADKANDELGEIASDNVLSKVEKKETLREWMEEFNAYYANLDNAEKYSVDTTDYEGKFYALAYYLNGNEAWDGSSIPLWLRDLTVNQEISGSVFRQKWADYYNAKVSLLDTISTAIKAKADEAQQGVDDVNDRVDDIVSDGVLSSLEKKEVLKEWQSVVAQYAINKNDADKYELDYSDYTDAYHALGTYLNNGITWTGSGTPLWLGTQIGVNTTLSSPTEYRKVWVDYYKAESILRERISEAGLGTRVQNFKTYPNELPVPPYNVGDRWMNAYYTVGGVTYAENDDMVCVQAKAKNEVASIRDWEFSSGMNSDTKKDIEASIKNLGDSIDLEVSEREGAISELQITIDGIRTLVGDAQDAADSAYTRANSAYNRANDAYSYADSAYQIADALGTKVDNNATAISQNSNYISLWAGNFNEQGEVITESGLVIGSTFTNLYSRLGDNVSYRASIASDLSGNFYFGTSGIVGSTGSLKYFTGGKKYKLYIEPNNATSLYLYYYDGSTGTHMASLIGLTEYTINSFNASKGNYMYVVMYGSTTSIDIRIVEVTGSSNNVVETDIITYTIPSKYHYVGYNSFDSFSKPLRKFNRGNKVNITIGSNDAYTLKLYYWNGSTRTQIASLNGVSEYVIESFNDSYGDYLVFEIAGNTSSFSVNINDAIEAGLSTSVQYDPSTGRITSNVKISADNVDINNGVVIIDNNSAKIGHFNISQKGLEMDSNNDGYIKFDFSGNKFVRINAGDSALFYGRHDSGTIMELNSYGSSATALKLRCNSSGIGFALDSLGNTLLKARYNTNKTYMEEVTIAGLALSYKYGNSLQTPTNPTMPITTNMWVDFIVLTGNLTLPVASNCHGKLLFVKCSSSYTLTVYDCVENQDSYTDYDTSEFNDNKMRAFFSAGSRWFELNLADKW